MGDSSSSVFVGVGGGIMNFIDLYNNMGDITKDTCSAKCPECGHPLEKAATITISEQGDSLETTSYRCSKCGYEITI